MQFRREAAGGHGCSWLLEVTVKIAHFMHVRWTNEISRVTKVYARNGTDRAGWNSTMTQKEKWPVEQLVRIETRALFAGSTWEFLAARESQRVLGGWLAWRGIDSPNEATWV